MREIEEIIQRLRVIASRASSTDATAIDAAIKKLERVATNRYDSSQSDLQGAWGSDSCPDCRPGRPCYGHGHY